MLIFIFFLQIMWEKLTFSSTVEVNRLAHPSVPK